MGQGTWARKASTEEATHELGGDGTPIRRANSLFCARALDRWSFATDSIQAGARRPAA